MPYIKAYLHVVWTTKNRTPYLNTIAFRKKVWKHIYDNALKKEIHIDVINGYENHCHCLISQKSNQTIQQTLQLLKGESAFWINKNNLLQGTGYSHFEWQDEYYAVGVCNEAIPRVRRYILNQEAHHSKISFDDELKKFFIQNDMPPTKSGGN